ncbi:MAG: DNA mismatch repair protein MutS [Deltaproteobacteria bacterium]|nr:DNA mismatch repair protein MutS [Deltaproteobacteria bacterium]
MQSAGSGPNWLTTQGLDPATLSPVMRQVLDAKRAHPDALVLFRLGDFYELFFEDALDASKLLDLTLTSRNKNDPRPIPMCGFPWHAAAGHVQRALEAGRRCAVVEQLQDAASAKGMIQRGVTHVITPGVVLESEALDVRRAHHLVALVAAPKGALGLAAADASTGWCGVALVSVPAALAVLLVRLDPRELVVTPAARAWIDGLAAARGVAQTDRPGPSVRQGGEVDAALTLLRDYLGEVRPNSPSWLEAPVRLDAVAHLQLPHQTVQHLELLATSRSGKREGSLLHAIDHTLTAGGARLLRNLVLAPLADRRAIEGRLGAVTSLHADRPGRDEIRFCLKHLCDVARVTARCAAGLAQPRELAALRDTLAAIPQVRASVAALAESSLALAGVAADLGDTEALAAHLQAALCDNPRAQVADGGVIRPGFDRQLDELMELCDNSQAWMARYEAQERQASGLHNARVAYNSISGYGIEVSRSKADVVPAHWRRKQTLKNVERYTTPELLEFERKMLSAETERQARESAILRQLLDHVAVAGPLLRRIGRALDDLDVFAGLAHLGASQGWTRPVLHDQPLVWLGGCRHPVLEILLPQGQFVANDVALAHPGAQLAGLPQLELEPAQLLLVTGPNMAGKSTLMRQVALCAILAQVGSFVPAEAAHLGVCDAVLTRIGAGDDIAEGASTFLVEMRETAEILRRATPRTLVVLDEIGRGTSTWDGLAIAWGVVEHLHDHGRPLCLCATHYHELTHLAHRLGGLRNVHVAVREVGHDVVFLHRLRAGPTSRSHGVSVARLAGLPAAVVDRARKLLDQFERAGRRTPNEVLQALATRQLDLFDDAPSAPPDPPPAASLDPELLALAGDLAKVDLDALSPRAAHALVEALAQRARALRHR